jgi:Tol biopolymer transport system component
MVPSGPQLSPDGRQVALMRQVPGGTTAVFAIDVDRGIPRRVGGGNLPVWSPRGDRITTRSRGGIVELALDGTGERRVVDSSGIAQDWSPDGRMLLYAGGGDLWAVALEEPRTPFAITRTPFDEGQGQFSPDGAWLAYASDETGRYEVYVQPFPSGEKSRVSTQGGTFPRWRRDGRELYYIESGTKLMAVPIDADPRTRRLVPGPPVSLFSIRLATGAYILSSGGNARAQYTVASDGRFLINAAVDVNAAPITIVQNWQAALGAR